MRIRPYTDADFAATVALWRDVTRATYTFLPTEMAHTREEDEDYFRRVIATKNELFLAESDDGVLLGYLAIDVPTIDRLYVALDAQRRGVGTALLDHARTRSPEGLRLFTHQRNHGARRFYEARGFEVLRYGVSPPPESEPDVEYVWKP